MTPDLSQPQLFLDDSWIAASGHVTRSWHSATKFVEPVLRGDSPVDYNCPVMYGSVLHWQGRFHMWYCGWTKQALKPAVCYAVSDDGVHWTKPNLGLVDAFGNTDNNLIMREDHEDGLIDNLTVIETPEDSDWPLKMLYWARGGEEGIYLSKSADGIHWQPGQLVLPAYGDRFNAVSQRVNGVFVAFVRAPGMMGQGRGRAVWRIESADLVQWSEPELVLTSDLEDPPHMEIYSLMGFPYGDLMIGSIERMHRSPDVLDPELCWSHDAGRTWQRPRTRPAFIERPPHPHIWDTWINLSANAPLLQEDKLWFYFSGRSGAHGCTFPDNHGAIGIATLRRDGFCSIQASEFPGWVRTPVFTWPGGDLIVNLDCRRDITGHPRNIVAGQLRVQVKDADGQALDGYAPDDATYGTNALDLPIRWGSDPRSLDALQGQDIQLEFHLRDAHLYSFRAG